MSISLFNTTFITFRCNWVTKKYELIIRIRKFLCLSIVVSNLGTMNSCYKNFVQIYGYSKGFHQLPVHINDKLFCYRKHFNWVKQAYKSTPKDEKSENCCIDFIANVYEPTIFCQKKKEV